MKILKPTSARRIARRLSLAFLCVTCVAVGLISAVARGQEANWIWAPTVTSADRPAGPCFFRKSFNVRGVDAGRIEITCDQEYTLYVNGVRIGSGDDWTALDIYDITPYLINGRNVLAVEAVKSDLGPAGLAVRVRITDQVGVSYRSSTGKSWKTSQTRRAGWQQPGFNDTQWEAALVIGKFGETEPWHSLGRAEKTRGKSRFDVMREFRVEWVVLPKETASLLAMSFDEFGNIIASRENGPLLLIRDSNDDNIPDKVATYCSQVTNCQGILALNGEVYVTGDGPDGCALYRLTDKDRNGKIDKVTALVKFKGKMEEHGPHGLQLGPDGLIYIVVGNNSKAEAPMAPDSPYQNFYEGDLVQPRYEDPRGHFAGVSAPGGTILRTNLRGTIVEQFAGGLRNPYDIAFNADGALLTADADMEWDHGMPWYRPTRVNHVVPGGEFGWRSGWAKWPEFYADSLPGLLDLGPGSPTGIVAYDHFMFPLRYHGTMFVGDWTQGRILAVNLQRQGASFKAEKKVFLEGNPLNVTDMEVGPDGWLYFCTGGRGTEGGVYRVVWTGRVPPEVRELGDGIEVALRMPQLHAAWARQQVAVVKQKLGDDWSRELTKVALSKSVSGKRRLRALDLMQLFGPFPDSSLLVKISGDRDGRVRARAAYLMGIHRDNKLEQRLVQLLDDPDPFVQRRACEALARDGYHPPPAKLLALLGSDERYIAWAASKVLANIPPEEWKEDVLASTDQRIVLMGSVALLSAKPDKATCRDVLARAQEIMKGFVADASFIDLLRVVQLALLRGNIQPADAHGLAAQMTGEFPTGDPVINQELVRVLAYMKAPNVAARYLKHFSSDISAQEKFHMAVHAPHFISGWSTDERLGWVRYYETSRKAPGGPSYVRYLDRASRDLVARMNPDEQLAVLEKGDQWPNAALGALVGLPEQPSQAVLEKLRTLDEAMARRDSESAKRLRVGIIAVLARSGDVESMEYLRSLFESEPERRSMIAMGLAQNLDDENWRLLVRALPILDGEVAHEVLTQLAKCKLKPAAPEPVRQVILLGLKQPADPGRRAAIQLLEAWTGQVNGAPDETLEENLAAWQTWFTNKFADQPAAELPVATAGDKYAFDQLHAFLRSADAAEGSVTRGAQVYHKAQCGKCHRFGADGEAVGPDLTTVARRFQQREILESIVFPSHVIADQYATKTVYTIDGKSYSGVVSETADGEVIVVDSSGKRMQLRADEIEEIAANKHSTMPNGLLNSLSLKEIADLFAYLKKPERANVSQRPKPR